MTNEQLLKYYDDYTTTNLMLGKLISVSGFKKYLMIDKKESITNIYSLDAWLGVRGSLDVLYENFLIEKAAAGERYSQTFTQLLNKFYDKQDKREDRNKGMANPITFVIDVENRDE